MKNMNRFFYSVFLLGLFGISQVHAMGRHMIIGANSEISQDILNNATFFAEDDERFAGKVALLNCMDESFSCSLPIADRLETNEVPRDSFSAFRLNDDNYSVFYINTSGPSRTASRADNNRTPIMDKASFALDTTDFFPTAYNVELIEEPGQWVLQFTEAYPYNPANPHIVIKSRRK